MCTARYSASVIPDIHEVSQLSMYVARDQPNMLVILPIMLCCSVQKVHLLYACINAQCLPIMFNIVFHSASDSLIMDRK